MKAGSSARLEKMVEIVDKLGGRIELAKVNATPDRWIVEVGTHADPVAGGRGTGRTIDEAIYAFPLDRLDPS